MNEKKKLAEIARFGRHGGGAVSMTATVRVGFIPLVDAALLVAADRNSGLPNTKACISILVGRCPGPIFRDKLNLGYFDAAHMLAPAAIASSLGLGHVTVDTIAPVALGLNGNAITVSRGLRRHAWRGQRWGSCRSDRKLQGPVQACPGTRPEMAKLR